MRSFAANALFYPIDLTQRLLENLIVGTVEPVGLDTVEFDKEDGGEAIRQLALPRLSGMDEVEIDIAQMRIRSVSRPIEISDFSTKPGPGGQGVFLSLPKPGRLLKVVVEYVTPPPPPPKPKLRLVVRAVKKSGSVMEEGVPLFADPDFDPPGPPGGMFPRVLTGMSARPLGGNRYLLTLPSVLGDAWLIQLATGGTAVDLAPNAVTITIHSVTLDAVPSNVAVVLVTATAEVPLWGNPQMLLPSDEPEDITFTPIAQKELAAALKNAGDQELTLPLTIKFRSDTAGALSIVSKTLQGRYVVRALSEETPPNLRLEGARVPLVLSAPAGLMPQSATFRIVAKLTGRELNNASNEPPATTPSGGLRVTQATMVGQRVQFEGTLPLVNVRLLLASESAAEAILQLREDANGGPGAPAGKPVVRQLDAGVSKWVDFELKAPLKFSADSTPLWVTLHATKGEALWFASEATDDTLISTDKGASWGAPDAPLAPSTGQMVQLFHDRSPEFSRPVIRVERSNTPVVGDLMENAHALSTKEFVAENARIPATVMSFYTQQSGRARVEQTLQLFSTSVLDLRVESASFFYDPFQPGNVGA